MRTYSKKITKILVCALVAALVMSGFTSISHASAGHQPNDLSHQEALLQISSAEVADKKDGHDHHANGGQECHSVSCNLYSLASKLVSSNRTYEDVEFSASTDQRIDSILASLYRPPRKAL